MTLEYTQSKFLFDELFTSDGLQKLDDDFIEFLGLEYPHLQNEIKSFRKGMFDKNRVSDFLMVLAKALECYLARLFSIESLTIKRREEISYSKILFEFKNFFIAKKAMYRLRMRSEYKYSYFSLKEWLFNEVKQRSIYLDDIELAIAELGIQYLHNKEKYSEEIEKIIIWCCYLLEDPTLEPKISSSIIFKLHQGIDYLHLLQGYEAENGYYKKKFQFKQRDGFHLLDYGMESRGILNEINKCMLCHSNKTDYCSKGFPVEKGSKKFNVNALDNILSGCPVEVDISEMLTLKKLGYEIAALAILIKNNPMCPVTGHRICNDCMKSCIYQKQEPVNVPEIETAILKDVLYFPWGFEIYDLLLRWNPLLQKDWQLKPFNGKKVAIFGLGPAGFTVAHYLLNSGCVVIGFDGTKLESLPEEYVKKPIYSYKEIIEDLNNRTIWGFGGVAEYGITTRWDKNYLKIIYISLMRRREFRAYGNVRFGGTITIEDAWKDGFDHIVLAVGAGLPKELNVPNSLAIGMRQASDFLMALQLTGLYQKASLSTFQIRLPAVVIGGGLTAVDTATEIQAYYIKQAEQVFEQYQKLMSLSKDVSLLQNNDNWKIIKELIEHGMAIKEERHLAKIGGRDPNFVELIHRWGGVTIAYRKKMVLSSSYRNNHLELKAALDQGVWFLENFEAKEVLVDNNGHIQAIKGINSENNEIRTLKASSIFVATGTRPNIAYEFEHKGSLSKDENNYKAHLFSDGELAPIKLGKHVKEEIFGSFTSYNKNGRLISFIGDIHPMFNGSVVKAVASAKRAYPKILQALFHDELMIQNNRASLEKFLQCCDDNFCSKVSSLEQLNNKKAFLNIKSKRAAEAYGAGQFFKLQLYETSKIGVDKKRNFTQSVFLSPTRVDATRGILSFQLDLNNENQKKISRLKVGHPIALMGPSGEKIQLPKEESVLLIVDTDTSYHPFLSLLISELNRCKNNIILIAYLNDMEAEVDGFLNLVVNDLILYSPNYIFPNVIYGLSKVHIFSDIKLMIDALSGNKNDSNKLYKIIKTVSYIYNVSGNNTIDLVKTIKPYLDKTCRHVTQFLTSTLGPMQCLLKGVCGQCLQWQIDPCSGKRTKAVFACSWHYQPYDLVDFQHLKFRKQQNAALEMLNDFYLKVMASNENLALDPI